ncbi:MAG: short-chain fatty acid transporter [Phycisphaerales bacterium]|nr:short-chain fatty acid transporter [Phycisphaerales bacterium]
MISRLGLAISQGFRRSAPDPFVLAILLTLVTAVLALTVGFHDPDQPWLASRWGAALGLLDTWRSNDGLWRLLAFGMQMCLILVTGHAVASAPVVRPLLERVARQPRTTASAAATVAAVACAAGLLNWGLGLIVGAVLARETGASLARRGLPHHYPLIVAAGYSTMMLWHGGLSGSAPLTVTSAAEAAKVLPKDVVQSIVGEGIPLSQTILSPLNLFVTGGLLVLVPIVAALLAPRDPVDMHPCTCASTAGSPPSPTSESTSDPPRTLPERLERSPILAWLLAAMLGAGLWRFGRTTGIQGLGLNEINAAMLALGLVLHRSPLAYMRAVEEAVVGCAGIILQFPLYAGIMGMMAASGLVGVIAEGLNAAGGPSAVPALSFTSAGIVNFFVPSGGGQWAIQGPIALRAGEAAGIAPGKMVMSVAYGDELTNMLQPFWALPLLAITGTKARDIVGYTAIIMVAGAMWMALGMLLF